MAAKRDSSKGKAKLGRPPRAEAVAGVMLHLSERQVLALDALALAIRKATGQRGMNRSAIVRAALAAVLAAGPDLSRCETEKAVEDAIREALKGK